MALGAKKWIVLACVAAAVVALLVFTRSSSVVPAEELTEEAPSAAATAEPDAQSAEEEAGPAEPEEPAEEKSEEELREEADEKLVDAFDSLTDKWMEKEGGEVTMKDMDDFVVAFKSVPDARKDECLHRALNLVSDDHVLLLAGILFDKSIDKEYLELVFNDVLNRDEEVKKLILPKIFKDKDHPCWADTAWILDVTGELPKKEEIE